MEKHGDITDTKTENGITFQDLTKVASGHVILNTPDPVPMAIALEDRMRTYNMVADRVEVGIKVINLIIPDR